MPASSPARTVPEPRLHQPAAISMAEWRSVEPLAEAPEDLVRRWRVAFAPADPRSTNNVTADPSPVPPDLESRVQGR